MTPKRFINELGALVAENRSREALDFWRRHFPDMAPGMTSEQVVWVADMMHMADMAVDLEAWDAADRQAETEARASRLS